jgi:hypothetical protein
MYVMWTEVEKLKSSTWRELRTLEFLSQNSNSDLTEGEIKKSKSQVLLSHTAVHVLRIIN